EILRDEESRCVDEQRCIGVLLRELGLYHRDLATVGKICRNAPRLSETPQRRDCLIYCGLLPADDDCTHATLDDVGGGLAAHAATATDDDEVLVLEAVHREVWHEIAPFRLSELPCGCFNEYVMSVLTLWLEQGDGTARRRGLASPHVQAPAQ